MSRLKMSTIMLSPLMASRGQEVRKGSSGRFWLGVSHVIAARQWLEPDSGVLEQRRLARHLSLPALSVLLHMEN